MSKPTPEINQPRSLSFADVNQFVHHAGAEYEELQWLCLSLATALERGRLAGWEEAREACAEIASRHSILCWVGGSTGHAVMTRDNIKQAIAALPPPWVERAASEPKGDQP